tara:strand:- start:390 stop:767 length:378 start_codon:yes stop_codon:yes gene_type:complete
MPRKGKGQQPIQTAKGQQYGKAKAQEESQKVVPLPMNTNAAPPAIRPGEISLTGPSQRPSENIMANSTSNAPKQSKKLSTEQRFRMLQALPNLERIASQRDASFELRRLVRDMRIAIGPIEELRS